ncbi:MAG TPA: hypothetical protein PLI18_08245, partial [Pirellulaceae bacterium]|nr:hypothetical protein [Pirellulaceae bacterium]
FLVGMVIDAWLAEGFRDRVSDELQDRLDAMERELLQGSDGSAGLERDLRRAIETCESVREGLIERLIRESLE